MFRQALALDPDFSRARAGLVHTYFYTLIYIPEQYVETVQALEQTVYSASARAPEDWATHLALALLQIQRHEWLEVEKALDHAAALAPAAAPEIIETRIFFLQHIGRIEETIDILQASMISDPLSVNRSFLLQFALFKLGRAEEGEEEYLRSLDLPGADAREDIPHIALLSIWNGHDAGLIESRFDAFLQRQTISTPWIAEVRAVYSDPEAALAIVRDAYNDPANQDPTRMQFVTNYAGHYDDVELALADMRRALVDLGGTVQGHWWPDMAEAPHAGLQRPGPRYRLCGLLAGLR